MNKGLVIRTTGSWYRVLCGEEELDCRLRGNYRLRGSKQTNPIAVGDWVLWERQEDGTGLIHEVLDRRNYLIRKATKLSKQTHVIAANIDLLCIVACLEHPRTSQGFIDRLLVTAEAYNIPACMIFNKCDLYDAELEERHRHIAEVFAHAGYEVLKVSAQQGTGVEDLKRRLVGRTVLFSGHSGVGKSALLNAIDPTLQLRTGEVSEWSQKGTHTTTFAEIVRCTLAPGVYSHLIDSPGIKEFGMVDFKEGELSHFFPEMKRLLQGCKFANCTHRHEPGCAIKEALDRGEVSPERYASYLSMMEELQEESGF